MSIRFTLRRSPYSYSNVYICHPNKAAGNSLCHRGLCNIIGIEELNAPMSFEFHTKQPSVSHLEVFLGRDKDGDQDREDRYYIISREEMSPVIFGPDDDPRRYYTSCQNTELLNMNIADSFFNIYLEPGEQRQFFLVEIFSGD